MTKTPEASVEALLTEKRIAGLDLTEFFATLMVVIYHISLCSYKLFADPAIDTAITYWCRTILVTCVPLFLTVNGFLLLRHELNLKKHILKTIRLFVLGMLWAVVPLQISLMLDGRNLSLLAFLKEMITFAGPTIHLWYMGALVCIYLFFPLIKLVYDRDKQIFLFFLAFSFIMTFGNRLLNQLATIIGILQGGYHEAEVRNNWFSIFNPYNAIYGYTFVYFCLGGVLPDIVSWLDRHLPKRSRQNLMLLTVLAAASLVHALWFLLLYHTRGVYLCVVWYGYNTMSALVMTMCVLLLCLNYQGRHRLPYRIVRLVSENSLGVYLLHMIILLPLKPVLKAHFHWLCNLPGNVLTAAAVTACCVLVTWLIRKLPGVRWLLQ